MILKELILLRKKSSLPSLGIYPIMRFFDFQTSDQLYPTILATLRPVDQTPDARAGLAPAIQEPSAILTQDAVQNVSSTTNAPATKLAFVTNASIPAPALAAITHSATFSITCQCALACLAWLATLCSRVSPSEVHFFAKKRTILFSGIFQRIS